VPLGFFLAAARTQPILLKFIGGVWDLQQSSKAQRTGVKLNPRGDFEFGDGDGCVRWNSPPPPPFHTWKSDE
jgi:hypothetical protein